MGDNSDDDWNADDEDATMQQKTASSVNMNAPEVDVNDTDSLLKKKKRKVHNGTSYEFSRSRNRGRDLHGPFCTPTRAAIMFASVLVIFGIGYFAGFMTPFGKNAIIEESETKPQQTFRKRSENWRTKMSDWGRPEILFDDIAVNAVSNRIIEIYSKKRKVSCVKLECYYLNINNICMDFF